VETGAWTGDGIVVYVLAEEITGIRRKRRKG
jgi:hypothetical protein